MKAVADFGRLVVKAFLSGLGVAVLMALAILALSSQSHAAMVGPNDAKTGTLLSRAAEPGRYGVVPTVATEVGISVTGMIARTRVVQYFHHAGDDHVEGVYVFPLPENAAVDRLFIRIGEREIEGRIQEKAQARATYERAKSEGRKAALVEQLRPNLFTNSTAHIGPGERIVVSLEYQQMLAYDNGQYRLRFPLAVTPRYSPPGAMNTEHAGSLPDEGCGGIDNMVDIAVSLDAGVELGAIESSYHETWIEKSAGRRALVGLARDQESADRDFELTWRLAPGAAPAAAVFTEEHGGLQYALLMVAPPQPTAGEDAAFKRLPRETLLVVDTSGSMEGTSMAQARAALQVALATLTPRDRFNVIEFNSEAKALFPSAVAVTAASLEEARRFVAGLRASGGTEMDKALDLALDGREAAGYLRQVVFITDGAVANEEALFALIAARLGNTRLFTVGIGSAPNAHFMTRAARFGRGTFTQVSDVREVEGKVSRLFEKIEAPVLRDVRVAWSDGTPVETYPARVPDLYLGEPIVLSTAASPSARSLVVSGLRGNQPWSVVLTPAAGETAPGVGTLWARSRIASLMDGLSRGEDADGIRRAVIQVALEHHLVSAYTSLVAVDVTPSHAQGSARLAVLRTSAPAAQALPQTDTESTVHLLLGLLALVAAGVVAFIGRRS